MGPSSHPRCYPGRLLYRAWKVLTCDLTARSQPEAAKGEALHRSRLPKAGMSGLLRGAGAGEIDWRRVRDGEAAFRAYIRGRLDEVAPRIGVGRDALLATLDQIAPAAAHVGVEQSGRPGRNERRVAALAGLVADLEGWGGGDAAADLAGRIVRAA